MRNNVRRPPAKKKCGMTLVELILALALLVIVSASVGTAIFSAFQSYSINRKLQEDEYNARLALLSMTREAHRGGAKVDVIPGANADTPDTLVFKRTDGDIVFEIVDGILCRRTEASTPVTFIEVEMLNFKAAVDVDERWLTLHITGRFGMDLTTTVALSRIPKAADSDSATP